MDKFSSEPAAGITDALLDPYHTNYIDSALVPEEIQARKSKLRRLTNGNTHPRNSAGK